MIRKVRARRQLHRARNLYKVYSGKLWFYPLVFIVGALALFVVTTVLDHRLSLLDGGYNFGLTALLLFAGSARSASSLLGAVAGAWTTILGVVFSITMVVLQLAGGKYTSQIIPRIEGNKITQITLGAFAGLIVYSLFVLRTVRTPDSPGGAFIPYIGVNLAIFWAVVSLVLTLMFVYHLSREVQGRILAQGVAREGIRAMGYLSAPTARKGVRAADPPDPAENGEEGVEYPAINTSGGYVQSVAWEPLLWAVREALVQLPEGARLRVQLDRNVYEGVSRGDRLGSVTLSEGPAEIGEELAAWVRSAYQIFDLRSVRRDPYYAVEQLRDTGVKTAQNGDADVVNNCLEGLVLFYEAAADYHMPRMIEVSAGDRRALVSFREQHLREIVLASVEDVFSQALGMQYRSAIRNFFPLTGGLVERIVRRRDAAIKDGSETSCRRAGRLEESLSMLLDRMEKLYGEVSSQHGDTEQLARGTERWISAARVALEAGGPPARRSVAFLINCHEVAQDQRSAELLSEALHSSEQAAREEGRAEVAREVSYHLARMESPSEG